MIEEAFIEIKNLYKTFYGKQDNVEVLRGIDLNVNKGDIFGVIGFSGAGKSTLVRCINRLEEPDQGFIRVGENIISQLNKKNLNIARKKIGMIFQNFNLFESNTVYENIAFSMKHTGYTKRDIEKRVDELLDLVNLTDKKNAYPGQLSGGQKQRVGIARALANHPDVLLCDEATSALDPQTTISVLDLLKDINRKLGLTIIFISHEVDAIRYACNRIAVIEDGEIKETGSIQEVFLKPKSYTSELFIKISSQMQEVEWIKEGEGI